MADIIQLLPDFVANQIAAGEVIQRPASVVKELVENAVDAGSTHLHLIVKDSGRTLVQVIDNGCGMSSADARLSFERHATSKISSSDDLFKIRTKGFRGEAMASIASVAQVELKTKMHGDTLGTLIHIEGSEVKRAEPCQSAEGTSISVKNLFFNVPARRQFLKSDQVELRHILEEFQRIALSHPEVSMTMHNNNSEVYRLPAGSLRQRITAMYGTKYDERLVPVEEETDVVRIKGFIGKPDFARKSRSDQFFFVNGRFIKHHYLNHAVTGALEGLLPPGKHPMYFLHLEVDPSRIDVNIHPTKTEVKFREERAIYPIMKAAIRRGLGKFQIAPTLDFEQESSMNLPEFDKDRPMVIPEVKVDPSYNPFESKHTQGGGLASRYAGNGSQKGSDWKELCRVLHPAEAVNKPGHSEFQQEAEWDAKAVIRGKVFQMGRCFLVSPIRSGMMLIDQQRAHERILYEAFMKSTESKPVASQRLLFPETLSLSTPDHTEVVNALPVLQSMGFEVEDFGGHDVVVHGLPADAVESDAQKMLETVLECMRMQDGDFEDPHRQKVALGLARAGSIKRGRSLNDDEMNDLIDRLFSCEMPSYTPNGKPVIRTFAPDDFAAQFE